MFKCNAAKSELQLFDWHLNFFVDLTAEGRFPLLLISLVRRLITRE